MIVKHTQGPANGDRGNGGRDALLQICQHDDHPPLLISASDDKNTIILINKSSIWNQHPPTDIAIKAFDDDLMTTMSQI